LLHIHTHIHAYIYTHIHTYIHTHTHIYTYIHTDTHTYIHTYTTGQRERKNGKDRNEDFQDVVRKRRKYYVEMYAVYMQIKRSPCR